MPRKKRGVSLAGLVFIFIAFVVLAISIQNLNNTNLALIRNLTDENSISETELNNKEVSATTRNIVDHYYYDQIGEGAKTMYNTILENVDTLRSGYGTIEFPTDTFLTAISKCSLLITSATVVPIISTNSMGCIQTRPSRNFLC